MELLSYIGRRLLAIIPTLLGASAIMFVLTTLIPGDPALLRLGNFATAEQLQLMREEMGLHKLPHTRYLHYLGGLLRGDMGHSWRKGFVLVVLVVYLLANLVVDLLYSVLNPQIRNA